MLFITFIIVQQIVKSWSLLLKYKNINTIFPHENVWRPLNTLIYHRYVTKILFIFNSCVKNTLDAQFLHQNILKIFEKQWKLEKNKREILNASLALVQLDGSSVATFNMAMARPLVIGRLALRCEVSWHVGAR